MVTVGVDIINKNGGAGERVARKHHDIYFTLHNYTRERDVNKMPTSEFSALK